MSKTTFYQMPALKQFKPNYWDIIAFIILFGVFAILATAATHIATPYHVGTPIDISLDLSALPRYAGNTVLRMFIALFFSFLFTFSIAPLAANNKNAAKIILPLIDILQSVPILGFLSITVVGFIKLFPNSLLGPECAAIFAIFTSQVWNMTLSLYQSLKTLPQTYRDTATIFHLSPWARFWKIEVPFALPGLLWNTMVSLSAGWFFVVASEAISVSNQSILLPGIGSYISVAISHADINAILYAILTMFIVIVIYDQLLFRPLLTWSERFHTTENEAPSSKAWFYLVLSKAHGLKRVKNVLFNAIAILFTKPRMQLQKTFPKKLKRAPSNRGVGRFIWNTVLLFGCTTILFLLWQFITNTITLSEITEVLYLGFITGIKVLILVVLASSLWIPIGVWIGLNPRASQFLQPVIQFLAAFPINLVYPIAITLILLFQLNVEIWSSPLMILGTQWYILFNVIAGTRAIPKELHLAVDNLGLKGLLWWKRLVLPAIFPYYITGAMTTAAGCWNASIVADVLEWGNHKLVATGLGSYISEHTTTGDFPRIALGITVMSLYVTIINRLVWHRLYRLAAARYSVN